VAAEPGAAAAAAAEAASSRRVTHYALAAFCRGWLLLRARDARDAWLPDALLLLQRACAIALRRGPACASPLTVDAAHVKGSGRARLRTQLEAPLVALCARLALGWLTHARADALDAMQVVLVVVWLRPCRRGRGAAAACVTCFC